MEGDASRSRGGGRSLPPSSVYEWVDPLVHRVAPFSSERGHSAVLIRQNPVALLEGIAMLTLFRPSAVAETVETVAQEGEVSESVRCTV